MPLNDNSIKLSYGMEKRSTTVREHPLGTRGELPDGRIFRYARADGAIPAGQLCMQRAGIAEFDMDLPVDNAPAVGTNTIRLDLDIGATAPALTADEYGGGIIYVNDGPNEGHIYKILSHPAYTADSSTLLTLTLETDDAIEDTALTTLSLVGLMHNMYSDVLVYVPDLSVGIRMPVGVANAGIANDEFFWLQTWGEASVLVDTTPTDSVVPTIGYTVSPAALTSAGVSGAVHRGHTATVATGEVGELLPIIGIALMIAAVTTDYALIYLTIRP